MIVVSLNELCRHFEDCVFERCGGGCPCMIEVRETYMSMSMYMYML
jgi:hypothetical protein